MLQGEQRLGGNGGVYEAPRRPTGAVDTGVSAELAGRSAELGAGDATIATRLAAGDGISSPGIDNARDETRSHVHGACISGRPRDM